MLRAPLSRLSSASALSDRLPIFLENVEFHGPNNAHLQRVRCAQLSNKLRRPVPGQVGMAERGTRRADLRRSGRFPQPTHATSRPFWDGYRRTVTTAPRPQVGLPHLERGPLAWRAGLPPGPVVMGILNVTPDSFSDGGRFDDLERAVAHGLLLHRQGADIVDIGGESTRPGAARIDCSTELARVLPVVRELVAAGVAVSVDTTRATVAAAALDAGAVLVNDVSGGLADPGMARVVADAGCPWVLMHWRGHSRWMGGLAVYSDVVKEVCTELGQRVADAVAAGVDPDRIVLDPGLGFAKSAEHNWQLSAHLGDLVATGLPVLVGASRKSYLGTLLRAGQPEERPVRQRDAATIATTVLALAAGAWGVRVHDVLGNRDAVEVFEATRRRA